MTRCALAVLLLLVLTNGVGSSPLRAQSMDAALKAEVEAIAARLTDGYAKFVTAAYRLGSYGLTEVR